MLSPHTWKQNSSIPMLFTPNFMLKLLAKDLRYAIAEGQAVSVDVSTAANALILFERAIARGDGDKDMAALVEQFRRK